MTSANVTKSLYGDQLIAIAKKNLSRIKKQSIKQTAKQQNSNELDNVAKLLMAGYKVVVGKKHYSTQQHDSAITTVVDKLKDQSELRREFFALCKKIRDIKNKLSNLLFIWKEEGNREAIEEHSWLLRLLWKSQHIASDLHSTVFAY